MIVLLAVAAMVPARIHAPPHVDGHLDDAVWQTIHGSGAFTQAFPNDGEKPTDATRVKVAYDDEDLYVAIECTQKAPIVARLTRRDREIDGDHVTIDLDTSHDRRSAFHFEVSAAGVLIDGLRYDDTELSADWDEVWQAEVATTSTGWSAELRIPLRILRLRDGVATWGFQVKRYVGTSGETDTWAYAPRDAGGEVSRYGELGPFDGLAPRGSIAIVPFGLSRLVRTDVSVPSPYGNGASAAGGIDVTWRPAPSIALSGAVLPDFGQVEADQIVINLTTTEIEYPEKRPFFLQGMDLFQTPVQLLYTRRIGRPASSPVLPDGMTQLAPVGAAPVLGAAKLIATAGALDIGALSVVTGGVDAITDAGPVPAALPTSHHVVRVRASSGGATIGALGTAQLQHDDPSRYPIAGGAPMCMDGSIVTFGARCGHDALAGGIDGAWRSSEGTWTASGQVVGSQIDAGPPRARTDGTVIRAGDTGGGADLRIAKEGGTLRGDVSYAGYSRRFDIDDLGYLSRANIHEYGADLEAYSAKTHGPILESRARLETYWERNLDGLALPSGYQANVSGTLKGMWEGFLELHWRPHYFDDRELGDGRALERSGRLGVELSLRSDPRRDLVAGVSLAARSTHFGGEFFASGSLAVRPRADIELSLEPDGFATRGEARFVDGSDALGPRFARQDATSFGVTTRAIWTLQRDLTIQAYVQALLATIHFRDAFVADPALHVIGIDDLRPANFDATMYDQREGALDATMVARWEYRPGSTAYLVYSHAQSPTDDRSSWDPFALVHGPKQDVILLKLSWAWLR